jgi:hypothetical protein
VEEKKGLLGSFVISLLPCLPRKLRTDATDLLILNVGEKGIRITGMAVGTTNNTNYIHTNNFQSERQPYEVTTPISPIT